jgi:hypothetical protein
MDKKDSMPKPDPLFEGDPPTDENGVDLSLIEHNLRLTIDERFEQHDRVRILFHAIQRLAERYYGPNFERVEDCNSVDEELLEYCCHLTPAQRLKRAEKVAEFVFTICDALAGKTTRKPSAA